MIMAAHVWNHAKDFEYCEMDGCIVQPPQVIQNGAITLDLDNGATNGTIISEIRDSTFRLVKYGNIIPKVYIPDGTTASFQVRCGTTSVFHEETWNDWTSLSSGQKILELTLSLTKSKIITEYDIGAVANLYYSNNAQFLELATHLTTAFINSLNEDDKETTDRYAMLWSAFTDIAMSGFARTDYDPGTASQYASEAAFARNMVKLKYPLPFDNSPVVIDYIPRDFVYTDTPYRYFQWMCELSTESPLETPILRELVVNYSLNYYDQIQSGFPKFFRRV
jgi:hypothetical protein